MQVENGRFVQITESVFTSKTLSKGAKLLYGALHRLPECVEDPRQQELDLGLPPPVVKRVAYAPKELATYMQCGVATVRKYVKELITEGFASWNEGKSRGKNRKLVLQLETPLAIEKRPTSRVKDPLSHDGRGQGEGEENVKPTQLEAFEMAVPPSPLIPLPPAREGEHFASKSAPSAAERQAEDQPPTSPDRICIPEKYIKEPLRMDDLAILEHCVNEEGNLDAQGYNRTLSAYFNHIWQTRQEHVFERAQTLIKIWLELRRQHKKPCAGDAQYPKRAINTQPHMT